MIHRTNSEGGASSGSSTAKMWRLGSALRKFQSMSSNSREERAYAHRLHSSSIDNDSREPSIADVNSIHESAESSTRQLQALVVRMRAAPVGPSHVDAAFKEFNKIRERCASLCAAILQEEIRPPRSMPGRGSTEVPLLRRDSSMDPPRSAGGLFDHRSSFSGQSLAEVVTGSGTRFGAYGSEPWLRPIRDWKMCLENLTEAFKTSLAETYKSYERDASPEMIEALFSSKKFRREAVNRMRNASVTRVLSADPQFFPRYEIRFRNYEKVKQDHFDIRRLLHAGESGISPSRHVEEFVIAPRGDAILEFANITADSTGSEPVFRFRVSSYLLAETSPIFARMFSGHSSSLHIHEAEDITDQLPPPPVQYPCEDGSEARLYRMPQLEMNSLSSLETLFQAAHMQNEKVPREVSFEQFVAIAECSMRYKSTSPLELIVEHRWLPQWMHKGADDMPDGLLIISYAFGLRQLFTRMSKSAILNLTDEKDLQSKPWPQKIRDKIWAVRSAKVAQLFASCTETIQEYIRPPARDLASEFNPPIPINELQSDLYSPVQATTVLTSTPRCPKGSHWCDASNLGWMMLVYNEMGLLSRIVQPDVVSHIPETQPSPKSLAQMMEALRLVPSPPTPVHPGSVCDPGPAFRRAVADVYNSVTGLTLYDISGKSHGWALSRHRMAEPQMLLTSGLAGGMATHEEVHSVVTEFPEIIRLRILGDIASLEDLHSAARINKAFYETYKRHELFLMRNILRADRIRYGSLRRLASLHEAETEGKVLKSESDLLKERGIGDGADAVTLRSDDEDEDELYSDDDLSDDTPSTPVGHEGSRPHELRHASTDDAETDDEDLYLRDPPPPFRPRDTAPQPPPIQIVTERHRSPPRGDHLPDTIHQPVASPITPQQQPTILNQVYSNMPASPKEPSVIMTEDIYEPPMTDEEARRILWPDDIYPPTLTPTVVPPPVEGLREKFRMGDMSFTEGREEKTLVVAGQKQLRSEHDRQLGILKKDGRPSSSGSHSSGGANGKPGKSEMD